jgi:hypothetical protein
MSEFFGLCATCSTRSCEVGTPLHVCLSVACLSVVCLSVACLSVACFSVALRNLNFSLLNFHDYLRHVFARKDNACVCRLWPMVGVCVQSFFTWMLKFCLRDWMRSCRSWFGQWRFKNLQNSLHYKSWRLAWYSFCCVLSHDKKMNDTWYARLYNNCSTN